MCRTAARKEKEKAIRRVLDTDGDGSEQTRSVSRKEAQRRNKIERQIGRFKRHRRWDLYQMEVTTAPRGLIGVDGVKSATAGKAAAYHYVDRSRLTDEYFRRSHWRQGKSRLLMRDRSHFHIRLNLARAYVQYGYYTLRGKERKRYRNKGRIYHYLGMIDAKRKNADRGVMFKSDIRILDCGICPSCREVCPRKKSKKKW